MFGVSFFNVRKMSTRFDRCVELKQLSAAIEILRNKKEELKRAAENYGICSLDYRKYLIIAELVMDIDKVIFAFNAKKKPSNKEQEQKDVIEFAREVGSLINKTLDAFKTTLMAPRNNQKEALGSFVQYGVLASAITLTNFTPITTIGSLITIFYGAPKLSEKLKELTGLNNEMTATMVILNDLSKQLNALGENLGLKKNWNKNIHFINDDLPEEFLCRIGFTIMKDPVICSLDGLSYEHETIAAYLGEKRESPYTKIKMLPNQTIKDVLVPNRNLKDLIDKFREENPMLFDDECEINKIKKMRRK